MIKKAIILLYIFLIGVLAAATLVETRYGTSFAAQNIYHSWLFCLLWGALSLLTIFILFRYALWRRLPVFLLHISFIIILAGALTTFLFGEKGYIHLRSHEQTGEFQSADSKSGIPLPFTVRLDDFNVEYYPGTQAPSDYVSDISYREAEDTLFKPVRISMNHIWMHRGYRFYQTSFDPDHKGTVLSVNHDPWGTSITYVGYLMLVISMIGILLSRSSRFITLLKSQFSSSVFKTLLFFCFLGLSAHGEALPRYADRLPAVNRKQADSLARQQIIYQDRVVPFNTLAKDFLLKINGHTRYRGLTPEQVIGGWILHPERWRKEPIIYIKDKGVQRILGLQTSYASLSDLYDGHRYRLQDSYRHGNRKLDKAIIDIDEKVGLISMLLQGGLIQPFAPEKDLKPLSRTRIEAEIWYNRIPFCKILFMYNLTLGMLGLLVLLYTCLHPRNGSVKMGAGQRIYELLVYAATLFHLTGYALYWYISGRIPLGNGYETMMFMALVLLILTCLGYRRYRFFAPFGFLLSGFTLLVAYLGQNNPQITPLMPVLQSPWLSSHVSLIMISYALFGFMMLIGGLSLLLIASSRRHPSLAKHYLSEVDRMTQLSRLLLYPAVFFLGTGIFLGAVWANESWGRYWAWDPKEVWALITFMIYGAAFHMESVHFFKKPLNYHTYMMLAFLSVLMTYFGVNYVLGGMHSYA